MKKIFSFVLGAMCASMAVVSCNKDIKVSEPKGEGALYLGVNMDAVATKAAMSSDELLANASVRIYMADFSGMVRQYKYSEAPSVVYLPEDSYRVDVIAGEAAKENPALASWEQKSYKGSSPFTITAGSTTNVTVTATVNNAVSKIAFDGSIAENFNSGYTFEIGTSDEAKLVYDSSKSEAEGYFIVNAADEPSFNWTFSGILSKDGSQFTKSGVIPEIEAGKLYAMTLTYVVKDGELAFELLVDYATDIIDDSIVFEPVSTGLSASSAFEIWAGHATIHADVDAGEYPDPTAVKFAYSADGVNWTTIDSECTSEGVYQGVMTGLTPSTEYTYKLVIAGEDVGESRTLTTEAAPAIPNGSFEYASLVSGASYYKFYDPNCGVAEGASKFWGSGNGEGSEGIKGSGSMGMVITYVDTAEKAVGNQSVRAQSGSILGMLAAGNLFAGDFMGLVGTSGGIVNFGRPWTSRPTAMRLWVKYSASKINIISDKPDGVEITNDQYDRAQLKIALGTWDYKKYGGSKTSPVSVNTTKKSTFVDFYTDPSTIANGELIIFGDGQQILNGTETSTVENNTWRQVTIPLNYHTTTEYPTHVVISFASSMFGDYFTGSDDAKLWVDGVEFLYE